MGSQTSRNQVLSDTHQSGIPGIPPAVAGSAPVGGVQPPLYGTSPRTQAQRAIQQHHLAAHADRMSLISGVTDLKDDMDVKESDDCEDDKLIPCVFTWTQDGRNIFLTGSFNNWSIDRKIKLGRSGHEFVAIQELPRAVHLYKFIVDDQWRFSPDQQTQSDEHGNVNNVLDISKYTRPSFAIPTEYDCEHHFTYDQYIPEASECTTDAPTVPILLSKSVCSATPEPPKSLVTLQCVCHHVYHDTYAASLFGPHVSCVAATQRWRIDNTIINQPKCQKHSTTLYFSENPLYPFSYNSCDMYDYGVPNPLKTIFTRPKDAPPPPIGDDIYHSVGSIRHDAAPLRPSC